jgi:hypothetical protein
MREILRKEGNAGKLHTKYLKYLEAKQSITDQAREQENASLLIPSSSGFNSNSTSSSI